jgi:signal transduction histidine kinase
MSKETAKGRWVLYALFAAAYLALDQASYIFPFPGFNVTPWNPHPALAVALLMLYGRGAIGIVYLTILAAELAFRFDVTTLASAALIAAVMTLGYSAMAGALRHRWRIAPSLRHRGDVVRMLGVVALGSLATGLAYVGVAMSTRELAQGVLPAWLRFWIGDGVGMVVTLPLLLMLSDGFRRAQIVALARRGEFLLQCAALAASLLLVFSLRESLRVEFFYLLFLPLIWISVRHGLAGTAPVMAIVQVGVVLGVLSSNASSLSVLELQALLLALAVAGFFIAVAVDERQEISENLRRTLRLAAAGKMAAAISHELNQPLTALNNYAQACRAIIGKARPGDPLPRVLALMSAEAMRAGDVTRRLRELFEGGPLERAVRDLGHMLAETVETFRGKHPELSIVFRPPPGPAPARVDEVQIALVLRNLLQNALEAMYDRTEKRIEVTVLQEGEFVRVDVIDSGPGVAVENQERIFELFYSDKPSGMGIGLSLCHTIIESHGGSLGVEPGAGGRFHFILPRAAEAFDRVEVFDE